jgi:hypothetical protein
MNNVEIKNGVSMDEGWFTEHKSKMQLNSNITGIAYGSPEHEIAKRLVETFSQSEIRRRIEVSGPDDWESDPNLYRVLLDSCLD